MPKRVYKNGVGKIVGNEYRGKFENKRTQFLPPPISEDQFHKSLIRVDDSIYGKN